MVFGSGAPCFLSLPNPMRGLGGRLSIMIHIVRLPCFEDLKGFLLGNDGSSDTACQVHAMDGPEKEHSHFSNTISSCL